LETSVAFCSTKATFFRGAKGDNPTVIPRAEKGESRHARPAEILVCSGSWNYPHFFFAKWGISPVAKRLRHADRLGRARVDARATVATGFFAHYRDAIFHRDRLERARRHTTLTSGAFFPVNRCCH
jgi:hypothetical protein